MTTTNPANPTLEEARAAKQRLDQERAKLTILAGSYEGDAPAFLQNRLAQNAVQIQELTGLYFELRDELTTVGALGLDTANTVNQLHTPQIKQNTEDIALLKSALSVLNLIIFLVIMIGARLWFAVANPEGLTAQARWGYAALIGLFAYSVCSIAQIVIVKKKKSSVDTADDDDKPSLWTRLKNLFSSDDDDDSTDVGTPDAATTQLPATPPPFDPVRATPAPANAS